jgi:hypothetical protein
MREVLQGMVECAQAHPGKQTAPSVSQMMPYLVSPEAKAVAAKIWRDSK